jgi:hypothetical protein
MVSREFAFGYAYASEAKARAALMATAKVSFMVEIEVERDWKERQISAQCSWYAMLPLPSRVYERPRANCGQSTIHCMS